MNPITQQQKQAIHTIVSQLKWTRDAYVAWLMSRYGVESCMDLTTDQAGEAIDSLQFYVQENKITEKQVSYIKFLWLSVDYDQCANGNTLLNNFLRHKYKVDSVEKLSKKQAFGAIAAIKRMQLNASAVKLDTVGGVQWVTLPNGQRVPTLKNSNIQ